MGIISSERECSVCGTMIQGGYGAEWRGHEMITLCRNQKCIDQMIHFVLDALFTARYLETDRINVLEQSRDWEQITSKIFWYKQYLRKSEGKSK